MNKQELISVLSEKTGETKKSIEQVCNALAETIREELLNNNEITLAHVGKFKTQTTSARNGLIHAQENLSKSLLQEKWFSRLLKI